MKKVVAALILLVVGALAGWAVGSMRPTEETNAEPSAVDVGFARDMVAHHQQAMLMSQTAMGTSSDPTILALAKQILLAQATETGTLQGWLTLWHEPQLPSGPPMTWMPGHEHQHDGPPMPGMASQQELDTLAALRGPEFDRQFVELMVRHHVGGVQMASYAAEHASISEVAAFAALMSMEQQKEIGMLQKALPS